jgi:hypothetical protein
MNKSCPAAGNEQAHKKKVPKIKMTGIIVCAKQKLPAFQEKLIHKSEKIMLIYSRE